MLPPSSSTELLTRAKHLSGLTLGELAEQYKIAIPQNSLRGKGWGGVLIEKILGATAGNKAEPDFQALGIELKTIPVDETLKPLESTYISLVPLQKIIGQRWEASEVCKKLSHVLWMPIYVSKGLPLSERRIGQAFLWQPTLAQSAQLQMDWEELMEDIALGRLASISSRQGTYLQIRPKGANGASRCLGLDAEGKMVAVLPRGFYLRPSFTKMLLDAS